jgi:hypothetical protein
MARGLVPRVAGTRALMRGRLPASQPLPGGPVVLADKTLLKTGAAVVTIAVTQPDGSLLTNRVTARKRRGQASHVK